MSTIDKILDIEHVSVRYQVGGGFTKATVNAVDEVSLAIPRGTTLGLVGESGSGKSSLAKAVVRIEAVDSGVIRLDGESTARIRRRGERDFRRRVQMIFQDPRSSLNPRHTILEIIREPMDIHRIGRAGDRDARVGELLELVGLPRAFVQRYPHMLSGGQLQRVAVARALSLQPELLVLDEPVSALDVSVQAQMINLLRRLQNELGLTYLFIAHDLAVVRHISDAVAVMYLGKIVEQGPVDALFTAPRHPYTQALIAAIPQPDHRLSGSTRRLLLAGDIPSPLAVPSGCRFHTRCPYARERCEIDPPELTVSDKFPGTAAACHFSDEITEDAMAHVL